MKKSPNSFSTKKLRLFMGFKFVSFQIPDLRKKITILCIPFSADPLYAHRISVHINLDINLHKYPLQ